MKRILLVEDEAIPALEVRLRLEAWGHEVGPAVATGTAAVESARRNPPDLVVMDIVLDDSVSGIDAATIIQFELDVPIVFLTAMNADVTSELEGRPRCAVVPKPYDPQRLREAIDRLMT